MSLTKAEMKTHVKEKHKQKAEHETSKSAGKNFRYKQRRLFMSVRSIMMSVT